MHCRGSDKRANKVARVLWRLLLARVSRNYFRLLPRTRYSRPSLPTIFCQIGRLHVTQKTTNFVLNPLKVFVAWTISLNGKTRPDSKAIFFAQTKFLACVYSSCAHANKQFRYKENAVTLPYNIWDFKYIYISYISRNFYSKTVRLEGKLFFKKLFYPFYATY